MADVFAWVVANASELLNIVFAVLALAALIVKLTPTPKDDAVLAKAYKVAEVLASVLAKKPEVKAKT
jgi:hypothetical protein